MKISFITSMAVAPWGGSEELWFLAALAATRMGAEVEVCYPLIRGWSERLDELQAAGVAVNSYGFKSVRMEGWVGGLRGKLLGRGAYVPSRAPGGWKHSDLVVVSQGGILDGLPWLEYLQWLGLRYAIICQANMVALWPNDRQAERLRGVYSKAERVYFVSEDNLRLFRTQTAYDGDNAEVVWNPLQNGTPAEPLPWVAGHEDALKLAVVGRMEPFAKGQDLVLEAFADPRVRELPITVSLHCHGPWVETCQRLIERWELSSKVKIAPFSKPVEIWEANHALLLPSRHEGMSLAMLEAMWLGRPVIATAVAGALSEVMDGENGFLIPGPSTPLLVETLCRAWDQRHALESMGLNAAERLQHRMPADPGRSLATKLAALGKSRT